MPVRQMLTELTHREFATWRAWLDQQWNEPDRTDHYLMQLAHLVVSCLTDQNPTTLDEFRIKFRSATKASKPKPKMSVEEFSALERAKWLGALEACTGRKRKQNIARQRRIDLERQRQRKAT